MLNEVKHLDDKQRSALHSVEILPFGRMTALC